MNALSCMKNHIPWVRKGSFAVRKWTYPSVEMSIERGATGEDVQGHDSNDLRASGTIDAS